jgi:hypothetical protein
VIAKRNGEITLAARRRERSAEQRREPMDKNRIGGLRRRASEPIIAKPISSSVLVVNPAVVRRRRSDLPWEICDMSQNVTEEKALPPDRAAEVGRGQSRSRSRRDIEALHNPKGGETDRRKRRETGKAW